MSVSNNLEETTAGRTNWSAVLSDLPSAEHQPGSGNRMSMESRNALIRSAGHNPDAYGELVPLEEPPVSPFPERLPNQYGNYANRLLYGNMSDEDKVRYDVRVLGPYSPLVPERRIQRSQAKTQRDIDALVFPENDPKAIADVLFPGANDEYIENIREALQDNPQLVQEKWVKTQTERITHANNLESQMHEVGALSTDGAVFAANFRRLTEDTYGGYGRAAVNLAGDVVGGAISTGASMVTGAGAMALDILNLLRPNEQMIRSRYPYGPLTEEQTSQLQADLNRNAPIDDAIEGWQSVTDAIDLALYRAPAQAGSALYKEIFSPLARGAGLTVPFLLSSGMPTWLRLAGSMGVGRQEAYQTSLEFGATKEDARLTALFGGAISGILEMVGTDMIVRSWRTPSPAGQLGRNLLGSTIGEGVTEGLQSLTAYASGEAALAMSDGFSFDPDRTYDALKNAAVEAGFGAILGGAFGLMGSNPVRTVAKEIAYRDNLFMLRSGRELISRSPDIKENFPAVKRCVEDSLGKSGAPQKQYIDAGDFVNFYQDDAGRRQQAMVNLDITQEQLDTAIAAGAQVEVSTADLILHVSAYKQDVDLEQWVRQNPEAPTLGILAKEMELQRQAANEFQRIQEKNKELPGPFKEFRDQIVRRGASVEYAQYVGDINYALAKTFGGAVGLTPEQYMNLNPIKVVLAKQLQRVQQYGDAATAIEDAGLRREATAAQAALHRYQSSNPGNPQFIQSSNGGENFAVISKNKAEQFGLKPLPIRMQEGTENFAAKHIRTKHIEGIKKAGFSNETEFVEFVSNNFEYVIPDDARSILVAMTPDRANMVVAEVIEEDGYYTVITGRSQRTNKSIKGQKPWAEGPTSAPDLGDPASLIDQSSIPPQDEIGRGHESHGIQPETILPGDSANVNQWNQQAIDTVLSQLEIPAEQKEAVSAYIQETLDSGQIADFIQEFQNATTLAEGLEQAARGIERILADPAGINEAVFKSMGIESETIQAGIGQIEARANDLSKHAYAFRQFYNNPDLVQDVRRFGQVSTDVTPNAMVTMMPDVDTVRLFAGQYNASSLPHELMHVYRRRMGEMVRSGNAPQWMIDDYTTLNEAVGNNLDSRDAKASREADELVSGMFERYLAEGKAPTPHLQSAFSRFRTWMLNVYRSIRDLPGASINPEVRGVFDRMLATQEDIDMSQEVYRDLENLAPPSGATLEQVADITARAEKARLSTEEQQFKKVRNEYLASQGGRKGIRQQVRLELQSKRQYKAISAIRDGGGMSRNLAEQSIGREGVRRLADAHGKRFFTDAAKMDANALSGLVEQYGYLSAADMIAEIADTAKYTDAVNQLTNQRIAEAEALVRLALEQNSATPVDEAYHNDALAQVFAAKQAVLDQQARAIAEASGRRAHRQFSNAALQNIARAAIQNMPGNRATQYFTSVTAYRNHAETAARADVAGDKITAADEYRKMRLNHFLIRESIAAGKQLDQFQKKNTGYRDWVKRLEGRSQQSVAPVEESFRNAIRDILYTYKIVRDGRIAPEGERSDTIQIPVPNAEVNPELAAFAPPMAQYIPEWIRSREGADALRTWRDLTVGQIAELNDALDILVKQGRGELQGLRALSQITGLKVGTIRTRAQLQRAVLDSLDSLPDFKGGDDRGSVERIKRSLANYFVSNLQIDRIAEEIDGNPTLKGQEMGVMRHVIRLIRNCEPAQMEMIANFQAKSEADYKVLDTMAKRLAKEFKSKEFTINGAPVPEAIVTKKFRTAWDTDMLRSVFFNVGNESNLETLKAGYGITDAHLDTIYRLATESEWRAIERIGKQLDSLYPILDAVFYRQTNKHLPRVEPTPITVTTKEGTTLNLDGWYYPKKYDPELSTAIAKNKEFADFVETMKGVFNQNTLERGFTRQRQENVKQPILLDTRVLVDHLMTATRWATHAEALLEFEALTTNGDVQEAMIQKIGREKYQYLREWANRMAKPDKGSRSAMNKLFSLLRKASTVSSLGLNMRSALRQNESFGIAADIMTNASRTKSSGWYWLVQGMKRMGARGYLGGFVGMQSQAVADMNTLSAEARMRTRNIDKDIRELTQGADPTKKRGIRIGKINLSSDMFFHFTFAMDQGVAGACWWGAFEQAKSGNANFETKGLTDNQIQEKAIIYADMVLRSQQSPYKADYTNFQADPGIQSLFTQFMGGVTPYLSHSAGMFQAWRHGDKTAVDMVRHLLNVYALPAFGYSIAPALLFRAIAGGDDDDESLTAKFAWAMANNMTGPLPVVRDIVGAAQYGPDSAVPPSLSTPGKAAARGWRGVKKLSEGDIATAAADFGKALAVIFPIYNPFRQMRQAGEAVGVIEED